MMPAPVPTSGRRASAQARPGGPGLPAGHRLVVTLALTLAVSWSPVALAAVVGEDDHGPGFGQQAEAREIVDRILGVRQRLDEAPAAVASGRSGAISGTSAASPVEQILGPSIGGGVDLTAAIRLEGSRALVAGTRADPSGPVPLMAPRLTSPGGGVRVWREPDAAGAGHSGTLDIYDVLLRWTPVRPGAGSPWTVGLTAGLRAPVLELGPPTDPALWPGSGAPNASTTAGLAPVVGGHTAWDYAPGVALRASGESGVGSVVGWSSYAQIRLEHVWRLTSAGTFSIGYLRWRESFGELGGPPAARLRRDALTLELRLGF